MLPFWERADALVESECDRAIALAEAGLLQPALVFGQDGYAPNPSVRQVDTSFHARSSESGWLYDIVDRLFAEAAQALGCAWRR